MVTSPSLRLHFAFTNKGSLKVHCKLIDVHSKLAEVHRKLAASSLKANCIHNSHRFTPFLLPTLPPPPIITPSSHIHILLLLIRPSLSIMLPAGVVNPNVSKAFEVLLNEAWYTVTISSDLSPLKRWAEDLNPPPDVMGYWLGWPWVGTC